MLCSILVIKPYTINYVCCTLKKNENTQEHMSGEHNNRSNRISEWRKDALKTFIKKLRNYRNHYTQKQNPNRYYLSPELTI
jgi:hypothetical protein